MCCEWYYSTSYSKKHHSILHIVFQHFSQFLQIYPYFLFHFTSTHIFQSHCLPCTPFLLSIHTWISKIIHIVHTIFFFLFLFSLFSLLSSSFLLSLSFFFDFFLPSLFSYLSFLHIPSFLILSFLSSLSYILLIL